MQVTVNVTQRNLAAETISYRPYSAKFFHGSRTFEKKPNRTVHSVFAKIVFIGDEADIVSRCGLYSRVIWQGPEEQDIDDDYLVRNLEMPRHPAFDVDIDSASFLELLGGFEKVVESGWENLVRPYRSTRREITVRDVAGSGPVLVYDCADLAAANSVADEVREGLTKLNTAIEANRSKPTNRVDTYEIGGAGNRESTSQQTATKINTKRETIPPTGAGSRNDDLEDPVSKILSLAQSEPREALGFIDRLPDDLRNKKAILVARFQALRLLALRRVFESNNETLFHISASEMSSLVDNESIQYLAQAMVQVTEIEKLYPGYIENLHDGSTFFLVRMVDDVYGTIERLIPAEIQRQLNWTKLIYFGSKRVSFKKGIIEQIPRDKRQAILELKFTSPTIVASAIADRFEGSSEGSWRVKFLMFERDYSQLNNIDEAGIAGTLVIFNGNDAEFVAG